MEISQIVDNLENFASISSDNELNLVIGELSRYAFKDFIYVENSFNIRNITIIELFEKFVNKISVVIQEDSIEEKVAIIKSLISIFQKGLIERNLVYFIIFLHANSIIHFSIGELVGRYDLNDRFNEILIKIFEILENVKIQVVDETLSLYFDKLSIINQEKTLITSLRQIDFEKHNSVLKNNKCLLPNHFYQMIEVLYDLNLELFEKLLISENVFTIVLITKSMSFNQINSFLIYHNEIKEKTLLCFLIKFFSIHSEDRIDYYDRIVNMSIQFYHLNYDLFMELMEIYRNNVFFNEVIGSMFCELSQKDIRKMVELISMDEHTTLLFVRTKMLEKCEESENFIYICKLIYYRWINFLAESFNEKEKSLNILCTDLCNFIISYYFDAYTDEQLLNSMKVLFTKIKTLDSDWSYNFTHHKNKFIVYYTKLFIFSEIYTFKKLKDEEIITFYKEFYDEYVVYKNFLNTSNNKFFKRFEQNILENKQDTQEII